MGLFTKLTNKRKYRNNVSPEWAHYLPPIFCQALYVYNLHFSSMAVSFLYTTSFNRLIILYDPSQLVCRSVDKPLFRCGLQSRINCPSWKPSVFAARSYVAFILSLTIFIRTRKNSCSSFRLSVFPAYVATFSVEGLTPNSKSLGSFISVPKIILAGDLHVESLTADRYASRNVQRTFLKWKVLVLPFQRRLLKPFAYMHYHTCLSLMLFVVALACSIYLLVCISVHFAFRLCCICVIHLYHTNTDVIVALLINSSMYICASVAFVLFCSCERYQVVSRNNILLFFFF